MNANKIIKTNETYWNTHADSWFGVTALPEYGVQMITEDYLNFFKDVSGKTLLEIGCGSGHSIKYLYDRQAKCIEGLDLSKKQLENASDYLESHGYSAKLYNASMEADSQIPHNHFDMVYSIYAIGWATDLDLVFSKVYDYLKVGGDFIFSWKHPLHASTKIENDQLVFKKSYFDEGMKSQEVDETEIILSSRKISTYINALSKAGFRIDKMIEETDEQTMVESNPSKDRSKKAQLIPLSFIFKAKKI